jgi:hypothetical protein
MYNLADGTLPLFKFMPYKKEFPYLLKHGLSFMTMEVLSDWHIYGPQLHLGLRLAYNPKADADTIMEDYWQKVYGRRAAPYMKQYWMGIDAEVARLQSHAGGFFGLQQIYTPEFRKTCAALLAKAAEAARGDAAYEQRVALHTEGFQSAEEYCGICGAMNRCDFAQASVLYDRMLSRLHCLAYKGWANPHYATAYLEQFLSKSVRQGIAATAPPNKLLQVLPDRWRSAFDAEGRDLTLQYAAAAFDDSKWSLISTFAKTLDAQGFDQHTVLWYRANFEVPATHRRLALLFTEVDGFSDVFVSGKRIEALSQAITPKPSKAQSKSAAVGRAKPRVPFEIDMTEVVRAGENCVALRVDHRKITDLSLGGIHWPVPLVEKPE